ncbi:hypothetical protein L3556_13905 [Candidatus Synechococcus calcipolaris G9]|uniref:Uncharacterized protein n=1 Tax=Candidatus Synechococcus calcipolaris G9 TaxID=1497997 RepID=A0ABT6F2I1_9SYNE|nr:hypothetical protein [Candidatus Synechococcus calcipolaris]MDG2992015.1 hypothetical protein [Candidatus Synechococcus calcipolaris G9]
MIGAWGSYGPGGHGVSVFCAGRWGEWGKSMAPSAGSRGHGAAMGRAIAIVMG